MLLCHCCSVVVVVVAVVVFGRPIENRRPMFLSSLVSWLVVGCWLLDGWSHEVEKMSNKLFSCDMQLCNSYFPSVCEFVSE